MLADGEDDGLADFAADGVAQGLFKEGFAEEGVGGGGKEAFFEVALFMGSLLFFAGFFIDKRECEALFGEELRGDIGADAYYIGVD